MNGTIPARSRILVVDDNEFNRDILTRRLMRQGYETVTAGGGNAALAAIDAQPLDLILMDIEMPEGDGMTTLKVIRTKYSQSELPVIMVTSRTDSADVVCTLDLGANDYITKPIDFPVAFARIRTQLLVKHTEKARHESEERYALATAGSNDGIWDWSIQEDRMFYSERWKAMLGCSSNEVAPTIEEWLSRIHPEDRLRLDADLKAHLDGTSAHFENEHRMLHRDGTFRWMLSRGLAIRNSEGTPTRIAGSLSDITAGKVADPLTGLANRVLFVDRLSRLAERAKRHKDFLFAVLFLDLDRFKLINDSFGHWFGDQVLIAFARRIEHCLRMSDTVSRLAEGTLARLGGDEFTVLLDGLKTPLDAERVAARIIDALKEPFQIGGHEIYISVSIGVALSSTDFERPEDLLRDADTAMYRAKSLSQGRIEVFDQNMRESAVTRLRLENDLRHGIERQEFVNAYQLIVSLESGKSRGFEALVRWQHPSRGIVPPSEFIPIAEDTGLIVPIGQMVMKEACRQIRAWHDLRPTAGNLIMAVNLSVKEFLQKDFVQQVESTLQSTGVDPSSVELEITESMVMDNPESARRTLRQLKNLGVRIGMDDFGTGYSSLSYLHKFPLDILKIDQSFVKGMEYDPDKREIIKTIIALAHNLKLHVTAEGVETAQQMQLLAELGCDCAQGYGLSRPLSPAAAEELLRSSRDWARFTERRESFASVLD